MRQANGTISRAQWQRDTVASLVTTFQLTDFARSVPAALLGRLIVMAACVGTSLSGAAQRTRRSPSGETVRKALLANLPEHLPDMERRINDSLRRLLPKAFFKRPRRLAIDLHLRPYYGQRQDVPVRGGKKKAGSKWFWTWATVAVVEHGQRWTVAMTQVAPGSALKDVLARLLEYVKEATIPVKMALIDREFYAADVIAALESRGIPFLMPAIRRGQLQGRNGPSGTRQFFQPGTTGFFEHTWTARGESKGQRVTVRIACVPRKASDRRQTPLVFAFQGLSSQQLLWYRETYRRRFGIETSYRQLGEGLAQTTTKRAAWRMMLIAVALLMRNLWVWRNQHVRYGSVSLSLQLHQLSTQLSEELGLILDFEIVKT
jgi:putative transposase